MTLFLSLSLVAVLLVLILGSLTTYSRTVTNDWARALKWVAVVLIVAITAVTVAERLVS